LFVVFLFGFSSLNYGSVNEFMISIVLWVVLLKGCE